MPPMRFQTVFIAVLMATALIVAALIINSQRPAVETDQPTASHVTATGKCAACHRNAASAIVHEYEMSRHAAKGVSCLDCHQPAQVERARLVDHALAPSGQLPQELVVAEAPRLSRAGWCVGLARLLHGFQPTPRSGQCSTSLRARGGFARVLGCSMVPSEEA